MKIIFLFVLFTQNNIFLTLANYKGEIIFQASLGNLKVRGLKKLNNSLVKSFILKNIKIFQIQSYNWRFHIKSKGLNKFKKLFLRTLLLYLNSSVLSFNDLLLESKNGCKLKKNRRL